MNTNRHIQRVVAWADIHHATAHGSLPRLGVSQYTTDCERQRLKDIVQQHRYSYLNMVGRHPVPAYFREILEDLQTLAMAKSLLMKNAASNGSELRPMFGSLLIMTEHKILELEPTTASSDSVMGEMTYIEAFKVAALIFAFHDLRDIAITAASIDKLVRRLREGLCSIFNKVFQRQSPSYIPDKVVAAPFLLWLCVNGWKASAIQTRETSRIFFVEKAARLCEIARIDTLEKLSSQICGIVFMPEYHMPACGGIWGDIQTRTASRDIQTT